MTHAAHNADCVDFRRSLPPVPTELNDYWARALQTIAATSNIAAVTHQSVPRGSDADRVAGAQLLQPRFGEAISPSRVILSNGTQSAILILMRRLVGSRGGTLLAERLSYGPLRLLAEIADIPIRGLEIDEDGVLPDAFEAACRSGPVSALYVNPTVQNPTTAIMPMSRRLAIADIARRHGVAIIEDDALALLHPHAPKPIAALAPDITWYVMTTTKCLMHGLRLAYLVAPSVAAANQTLSPIEHLSYWHPAPLMAAIASQWTLNGVAQEIQRSIAAECAARESMAREILSGFDVDSKPGSMHLWLKLPPPWTGASFMRAAERAGVQVRAAELFAVDDTTAPAAVRLSLSTPETLTQVRHGLDTVSELLANVPMVHCNEEF